MRVLEPLSLAGFSEDLISVTSQEIKRQGREKAGKGRALKPRAHDRLKGRSAG